MAGYNVETPSERVFRATEREMAARNRWDAARDREHQERVVNPMLQSGLDAHRREQERIRAEGERQRAEFARLEAERAEEARTRAAEVEAAEIRRRYFAANAGATEAEFRAAWPDLVKKWREIRTFSGADPNADALAVADANMRAFETATGRRPRGINRF